MEDRNRDSKIELEKGGEKYRKEDRARREERNWS